MWRGCKVLLVALLTGCSEASRTTLFESLESPRGEFTLEALVIEPWFPQGPYRVSLQLIDLQSNTTQALYKTELAYDGVPFTKQNIGLRWTSDATALVCLRATDRPDQGVQISLRTTRLADVIVRKGC